MQRAKIFFTLALVGGKWLASRPCHFTLEGRPPRCPLDRRLSGPPSQSGRHREMKILDTTGTQTAIPLSFNPLSVAIPTALPWLFLYDEFTN
jgi:hypothetical protein